MFVFARHPNTQRNTAPQCIVLCFSFHFSVTNNPVRTHLALWHALSARVRVRVGVGVRVHVAIWHALRLRLRLRVRLGEG